MKYTSLFLPIAILALSCEESNVTSKQPHVSTNEIDSINEKKEYPYLTNSEVELLIKSKDPNFMSSIWIGMTESESYEILRYLIEKQIIFGDIYNSHTGKHEPLSRYNIKEPDFKDNNRNLYCFLTPNIKKINCMVDLEFNQLGSEKFLKSISVSMIQDVTLEDFNDFIQLFTSKYGAPVSKSNEKPNIPNITIGEVFRRYSFEKENKLVDITFESSHVDPTFGTSPNHIHIKYEDKTIKNQESEKLKENMRQNIQRTLTERNESYKNI